MPSAAASTPSPSGAMFLKKLFDMMHTTPPSIGGWCQGGTAFEIKKPKEFAHLMLPKYFKHSKLSSFVRQLNFYGFQKCKKEVLLVAHETDESKTCLTFFHQHFVQHKPHLMNKIKRKTNYTEIASDGSTVDEVEELRHEVSDIKSTLSALSAQLGQLAQLVSSMAPLPTAPVKASLPLALPRLEKQNSLIDALEYLEDDGAAPTSSSHGLQPLDTTYLAPLFVKCDGSDTMIYQC
ncbi:hypothetical protein H310_02500 [Aphanomyces invadans]|uniref:HSF-type DNA-binding domain-containing protein n=1 Tax=Aphanomyces invadans TaxID=157072 RepID=A0A024URB3_9STRA|nr:hypothetical protein H310_02500 [Aphanomyces invadans]ETW08163.1 hypothetical protein H310_02500 [Aphanomyces invadans]|eukprot:XP_008864256.1 hypothetical protein H310_02500 [Aphanomyces invadans]